MGKFWSSFRELTEAYRKNDPSFSSYAEVILLYPGLKAWLIHRLAHALYVREVKFLPRWLSEMGRMLTGIDIHAGATLGRVIMDHGTGIVIGETAVVGDDVLIYQGVTLGGTALERIKRHPTIENNCVIGAGAKVLGNITVGEGSRVGANSVVVRDVPPGCTVVGVPGKAVLTDTAIQGHELEHGKLPDPMLQKIRDLEARLNKLEAQTHVAD